LETFNFEVKKDVDGEMTVGKKIYKIKIMTEWEFENFLHFQEKNDGIDYRDITDYLCKHHIYRKFKIFGFEITKFGFNWRKEVQFVEQFTSDLMAGVTRNFSRQRKGAN